MEGATRKDKGFFEATWVHPVELETVIYNKRLTEQAIKEAEEEEREMEYSGSSDQSEHEDDEDLLQAADAQEKHRKNVAAERGARTTQRAESNTGTQSSQTRNAKTQPMVVLPSFSEAQMTPSPEQQLPGIGAMVEHEDQKAKPASSKNKVKRGGQSALNTANPSSATQQQHTELNISGTGTKIVRKDPDGPLTRTMGGKLPKGDEEVVLDPPQKRRRME